ncbi:MAG: ZIP family metal transporter [Paludibacter sp.]|nr:ZIP family metal transporter [Paludibacter sp.]
MEILLYTIISLLAASVGSVLLAGTLLLLNNKWLEKISSYLLYLAGGTLLGAALIGLIPEATESLAIEKVLIWVLIGIILFFILEKIVLWHNCHDSSCERQNNTAAPMIIIGDAFHNATDGVVIAASFLTSTSLGVFVTISVVLHEIPQEMGDFGILLKSGYSRKKAMFYNLFSSCSAIVAGVAAYYLLDFMQMLVPYVIAISAASFLYISLADLIPEMHKETRLKESLIQLLLILTGIAIIIFAHH